MAKILLIEDDPQLLESLVPWLEMDGHAVETIADGRDGLQMLQSYKFDVVVLDWGLPSLAGIEVLKHFRAAGGITPIIFLTGQGDLQHKKEGLDSGADDYLTKPFEAEELSSRIRSLLRRPPGLLPTTLSIGNVTIQAETKNVLVDSQPVALGKREFAVLEFLMRHPNRCYSSQALMEAVWPSDSESSEDAVRACMKTLRRKLTRADSDECIIKTVLRAGYIIERAE